MKAGTKYERNKRKGDDIFPQMDNPKLKSAGLLLRSQPLWLCGLNIARDQESPPAGRPPPPTRTIPAVRPKPRTGSPPAGLPPPPARPTPTGRPSPVG